MLNNKNIILKLNAKIIRKELETKTLQFYSSLVKLDLHLLSQAPIGILIENILLNLSTD